MPIDVLFIHSAGSQSGGQGSSPFLNHLRDGLGSSYKVNAPKMPAPTTPSYERWKEELQKHLSSNKHPCILIGHSLGGSVLLKYLSEQSPDIHLDGIFIVAAPYWGSKDWQVEEFILRKNFAKAFPKDLRIFLYQSCDDEVAPVSHLTLYSDAIPEARIRRLDGGGHAFKSGLFELIQDIRQL